MINDFRTTLLNLAPANSLVPELGEELIDPSFNPRKLPPLVQGAYARLFGRDPQRTFVNFVGQQLLQLVHSSPLASYITEDDPRITYHPEQFSIGLELPSTRISSSLALPPGFNLASISGTPDANDEYGWLEYSWRIELAPAVVNSYGNINGDAYITYLGNSYYPPGTFELAWKVSNITPFNEEYPLATLDGFSGKLPHTDMTVWFPYAPAQPIILEISTYARPEKTISQRLTDAVSTLSAAGLEFVKSYGDTTLRDIFETADEYPVRMAAFLIMLTRSFKQGDIA